MVSLLVKSITVYDKVEVTLSRLSRLEGSPLI